MSSTDLPVSRRPGRPRLRPNPTPGNRTFLLGIAILKTVAKLAAPGTLSEVARAAKMSPSRVHRYLEPLVQSELLRYDVGARKYSLGPAAMELGAAAISQVDPVQVASEVIRELTETTRLASHISVWGSSGVTVIRWEQGTLESAFRVREGQVLNLVGHSSAAIFLTYLDPKVIAPFVERDLANWNLDLPRSKKVTAAKVRSLRKDIQENGLASASGMRFSAIAAPIFNRDGLVMSVTLSGVPGSFNMDSDALPAVHLREAANRITQRLGGVIVPGMASH